MSSEFPEECRIFYCSARPANAFTRILVKVCGVHLNRLVVETWVDERMGAFSHAFPASASEFTRIWWADAHGHYLLIGLCSAILIIPIDPKKDIVGPLPNGKCDLAAISWGHRSNGHHLSTWTQYNPWGCDVLAWLKFRCCVPIWSRRGWDIAVS